MPTATLTSKGQITVPREVRKRLGLSPGDRVDFEIDESGVIRLRSGGTDVGALRGLLKRPGRQPVSLERMEQAIRRGALRP